MNIHEKGWRGQLIIVMGKKPDILYIKINSTEINMTYKHDVAVCRGDF